MSARLQDLPEPSNAFEVAWPFAQIAPLVLASPHSGRNYRPEFIASSRLDPRVLRRSEDSFVDELFASAPNLGAPLIAARFPRAYCDVNRECWELDPAMFEDELPSFCNTTSRRVAAGFGTIARVVSTGDVIHRHKLRFDEAQHRIETCWKPYHAALRQIVDSTRGRFGQCLLIDCHSMPTELSSQPRSADFVLGDAHGVACAAGLIDFVEDFLGASGYSTRRNDPYAGGFVTRHYGRPDKGVHVLQLEIARGLYMDERRHEKRAAFDALRAMFDGLIGYLNHALTTRPELFAS